MSRTRHYLSAAVQLCGRQVGPSSYSLELPQYQIAHELGISLRTFRHHLEAGDATVKGRSIIVELVDLEQNAAPGSGHHPPPPRTTAPFRYSTASSTSGGDRQIATTEFIVSLLTRAAELQAGAADLLVTAANLMRTNPTTGSDVENDSLARIRESIREPERERSRLESREVNASLRASLSQSEGLYLQNLTDLQPRREQPRDLIRDPARDPRRQTAPTNSKSPTATGQCDFTQPSPPTPPREVIRELKREVTREDVRVTNANLTVLQPLIDRCERLHLSTLDQFGMDRLAKFSAEELSRGVRHILQQMTAGKVTKPFGLLIKVMERDALPITTRPAEVFKPEENPEDSPATPESPDPGSVVDHWSDAECATYYETQIKAGLSALRQQRDPSPTMIRLAVSEHVKTERSAS
jgi:hypothetical protein